MFFNSSPIVLNVSNPFASFAGLAGNSSLNGDFEIGPCQHSRRYCHYQKESRYKDADATRMK